MKAAVSTWKKKKTLHKLVIVIAANTVIIVVIVKVSIDVASCQGATLDAFYTELSP